MKTIKFTNESGDVDVSYLVDLIGDNNELTVYQITGLDDEDVAAGINFRELQSTTLVAFEQFAETYNLTMQVLEEGETTVTSNSYTALAVTTTTLPDGTASGAAQVETLTFPATSSATQGDYVVISNYNGDTLAAWLDIDGDGTEPTGEKYTGADYTLKVPIETGGTATENGTLFYEGLIKVAVFSDYITVVDNEDGSVEITQNVAGDVDDADPENIDSTGVGSITASTDTGGSGTAYTDTGDPVTVEAEGGNAPIVWTATSLPAGLSIDPYTGVISGVPTAAADTYTTTITATDLYDVTDSAELDITLA